MTTATSTTRTLQDSELIKLEQALRLSVRGLGPQSYTIQKVQDALQIVQAIPHSDACDCDYCHERREKKPNPYLCSVPDCGFYRNDDSEFYPSHY